jgi:hypothetical protein
MSSPNTPISEAPASDVASSESRGSLLESAESGSSIRDSFSESQGHSRQSSHAKSDSSVSFSSVSSTQKSLSDINDGLRASAEKYAVLQSSGLRSGQTITSHSDVSWNLDSFSSGMNDGVPTLGQASVPSNSHARESTTELSQTQPLRRTNRTPVAHDGSSRKSRTASISGALKGVTHSVLGQSSTENSQTPPSPRLAPTSEACDATPVRDSVSRMLRRASSSFGKMSFRGKSPSNERSASQRTPVSSESSTSVNNAESASKGKGKATQSSPVSEHMFKPIEVSPNSPPVRRSSTSPAEQLPTPGSVRSRKFSTSLEELDKQGAEVKNLLPPAPFKEHPDVSARKMQLELYSGDKVDSRDIIRRKGAAYQGYELTKVVIASKRSEGMRSDSASASSAAGQIAVIDGVRPNGNIPDEASIGVPRHRLSETELDEIENGVNNAMAAMINPEVYQRRSSVGQVNIALKGQFEPVSSSVASRRRSQSLLISQRQRLILANDDRVGDSVRYSHRTRTRSVSVQSPHMQWADRGQSSLIEYADDDEGVQIEDAEGSGNSHIEHAAQGSHIDYESQSSYLEYPGHGESSQVEYASTQHIEYAEGGPGSSHIEYAEEGVRTDVPQTTTVTERPVDEDEEGETEFPFLQRVVSHSG